MLFIALSPQLKDIVTVPSGFTSQEYELIETAPSIRYFFESYFKYQDTYNLDSDHGAPKGDYLTIETSQVM